MSIICDHVRTTCPKVCPHREPHDPIKDFYEVKKGRDYHEGYCDRIAGPCGWTGGFAGGDCQCKPTIENRPAESHPQGDATISGRDKKKAKANRPER